MHPQWQPKADDGHEDALDLNGLEQLLEIPEISLPPAEQVSDPEHESEARLIVRLLDQLNCVTDSVKEARERLEAANERMSTLSTVIALQSRQLELMNHYQNQAAKVSILERHLKAVLDENAKLRRPFWQKVVAYFRRQRDVNTSRG